MSGWDQSDRTKWFAAKIFNGELTPAEAWTTANAAKETSKISVRKVLEEMSAKANHDPADVKTFVRSISLMLGVPTNKRASFSTVSKENFERAIQLWQLGPKQLVTGAPGWPWWDE